MGRKRSTTYRTLTTPIVVPVGSVINLPSNNYTSRTIYYSGNIELTSIPPGITEWTAHTPVGYVKANDVSDDPCFYYYVHDHLGNVCAVWSAETNSFVQKTFYYPSGVPMNISTNQAAQHNKYNGKPYEEMHGFDIYEYEARGYYATIMRFTAMDPLCEQTPWQSPYVYAANNPICNVDWMGQSAYTTSSPDAIASLLSYLSKGGSLNDYDFNDDGWIDITAEIEKSEPFLQHKSFFDFSAFVGPGAGGEVFEIVVIGHDRCTYHINDVELYSVIEDITKDALGFGSNTIGAAELSQVNPLVWKGKNGRWCNFVQRFGPQRYVYSRSYELAWERITTSPLGRIGTVLSVASIGITIRDISYNGLNMNNATDLVMSCISLCGPVGVMISTSYSIANLGTELIVGSSIPELFSEHFF